MESDLLFLIHIQRSQLEGDGVWAETRRTRRNQPCGRERGWLGKLLKPSKEDFGCSRRLEQCQSTGVFRMTSVTHRMERFLGASPMPAVCRNRGPPSKLFPGSSPIYRYYSRPVTSSAFHGSPLLILTANLAGGLDHHPCTDRHRSIEIKGESEWLQSGEGFNPQFKHRYQILKKRCRE